MSAKVTAERREQAAADALNEVEFQLEANLLYTQVGEQLERFLKKRKLTRSAAAKLFGRPESFIAERIRGRNMTLRSLAELGAILGAEVTVTFRPRTDSN